MFRVSLTILFFLLFCFFKAQDYIYYIDGTKEEAKILEIYSDRVVFLDTLKIPDEVETKNIVLIQFKNNTSQFFNSPTENLKTYINKTQQQYEFNNSIGFNIAALALGDINFYLGKKIKDKNIDFNLFGAYNISNRITVFNSKFTSFSFAKRLTEFGASVNYNFTKNNLYKKRFVFVGILFKQTYFQYNTNFGNNYTTIVQYKYKTTFINSFLAQYGFKYKPTEQLILSSSIGLGFGYYQSFFYKDLVSVNNYNKNSIRGQINLNVGYLFK